MKINLLSRPFGLALSLVFVLAASLLASPELPAEAFGASKLLFGAAILSGLASIGLLGGEPRRGLVMLNGEDA